MVSDRVQKVCYRFIASVFLNGQAVHLTDYWGLDRVFLPADFLAVVYPSEPEWCTGSLAHGATGRVSLSWMRPAPSITSLVLTYCLPAENSNLAVFD